MVITGFEPFGVEGRRLLLGVAHAESCAMLGMDWAEFSGHRVRIIKRGGVAALVCELDNLGLLGGMLRRSIGLPDLAAILSALSSVCSFVPIAPGSMFESEEQILEVLAARGTEILEFIDKHATYLECILSTDYSDDIAVDDVVGLMGLSIDKPQSKVELSLIERTLAQSLAGRKAEFYARLRRCLSSQTVDLLPAVQSRRGHGFTRRVLIERSERHSFREQIKNIATESGQAALLRLSPFLPPVSFRMLEILSPNEKQVVAARSALGIGEVTERSSIRMSFHRALQRQYPSVATDNKRSGLSALEAQFALLDLVAVSQIKTNKISHEINLDLDSLRKTWILHFHAHDVADKVA